MHACTSRTGSGLQYAKGRTVLAVRVLHGDPAVAKREQVAAMDFDAEAVVAAFKSHPHAGTVAVDGKMVDRPHLDQARQLLQRARGVANDA